MHWFAECGDTPGSCKQEHGDMPGSSEQEPGDKPGSTIIEPRCSMHASMAVEDRTVH